MTSTSSPRSSPRSRAAFAAAVLIMVAGAAAASVGTTLGLLSSKLASGTDRFAAGTVTLSTTASSACNVGTGTPPTAGPVFPGNASTGWSTPTGSDAPCTLQVTYGGTLPGFLGLDILIAGKAGTLPSGVPAATTATPLYDGTAQGLQLQITDTRNGATGYYLSGTKYTAQGASPPPSTPVPSVTCPSSFSGYSCFQVTGLLVSTTAFVTGNADTFTVNFQLPSGSTSGYENSTATVVLSVHAVQAGNNALPSGCTALAQCVTNFHWS